MGGGLAFLNKKTWHPGSFRNQEEVWKREQQAAAEARKVEELRKAMEDERKKDDFVNLAVQHGGGGLKKSEGLDWMYSGSMAAKEDAAKRAEEHLLGKPATLAATQQETSRAEAAANLSVTAAAVVPTSQNETWRRLNNDPLFAIMRQQQEQLTKIRQNPVKMQEIIRSVVAAKEKKKEKKEKKKSKKEARKAAAGGKALPQGSSDSEIEERPLPGPPPLAHHSHHLHNAQNHMNSQDDRRQQQHGDSLGPPSTSYHRAGAHVASRDAGRGPGPMEDLAQGRDRHDESGSYSRHHGGDGFGRQDAAAAAGGRERDDGHKGMHSSYSRDAAAEARGRGNMHRGEGRDTHGGHDRHDRGAPATDWAVGSRGSRGEGHHASGDRGASFGRGADVGKDQRIEEGHGRSSRRSRSRSPQRIRRQSTENLQQPSSRRRSPSSVGAHARRHASRRSRSRSPVRAQHTRGRHDSHSRSRSPVQALPEAVAQRKRHDSHSRSRSPQQQLQVQQNGRGRDARSCSRSPKHQQQQQKKRHDSRSTSPDQRQRSKAHSNSHSRSPVRDSRVPQVAAQPGAPAVSKEAHRVQQPEYRPGYGLAHASAAPDSVRDVDTSARAAETRARLEEGARRREEEGQAKAAALKAGRREYQTGKISEETKAARLAEMMGNAAEHDAVRLDRLKRAKDAEETVSDTLVANTDGANSRKGNAFMQAATRDVYEAMAAGGTSIESRVNSRKHFNVR